MIAWLHDDRRRTGPVSLLTAIAAVGLIALAACQWGGSPQARDGPSPTSRSPGAAAPNIGVAWLASAIEDVKASTYSFGLRDSTQAPMDTLKVVAYPDGYMGVYHVSTPAGFVVRIAISTSLRSWRYQAQLDASASQPTLFPLAGGGYVLAVEAENSNGVGSGRRWLRFRHYADVSALLAARSDRTFNAPHTLTAPGRGAEGTPNIYSAEVNPDIGHSDIEVGFHYLTSGVDREARGVLTNFSSWKARPKKDLDNALNGIGMHGKHGDRDAVRAGGNVLTVVEAQDGSDDLWRIELFESDTNTARTLHISTPGGSRSFANPTVTLLGLPDGQEGVVVTLFLPLSGAAPGEAGQLLYFRPLPAQSRGAVRLAGHETLK